MKWPDSILIQQIRLLDPLQALDDVGDIWIHQGKIQALGKRLVDTPPEVERVDGRGWILGPGLIDLYSQSGEPGFEQRETLASLAMAALAGGFTQVGLLPTLHPPMTTVESLQGLKARLQATPGPRWLPFAALTEYSSSAPLTNLAELSQVACGFCQGTPTGSLAQLQRILDYLQPLHKPVFLWPWDRSLVRDGVAYEGVNALQLGLPGIPAAAETAVVAALLELIRRTPTPVHLMRISQARSLDLLSQAQSEGLPITASVSWMHLLLSEREIHTWVYSPMLRLEPPLGSPENQQALIRGVTQGILTAIATDHHPYTIEEKEVAFGEAPPGAIGLPLALPLLWSHLVESGQISALELWSCLSVGPATCLGLAPPSLQLGHPANLVILDPTAVWELNEETRTSLSQATPWWRHPIPGKVVQVMSPWGFPSCSGIS
jgi:dihydroorotase